MENLLLDNTNEIKDTYSFQVEHQDKSTCKQILKIGIILDQNNVGHKILTSYFRIEVSGFKLHVSDYSFQVSGGS